MRVYSKAVPELKQLSGTRQCALTAQQSPRMGEGLCLLTYPTRGPPRPRTVAWASSSGSPWPWKMLSPSTPPAPGSAIPAAGLTEKGPYLAEIMSAEFEDDPPILYALASGSPLA